MIDLTTLAGDDTEGRVRRLCAKAAQPVRAEIFDALGMPHLTTGAVCVYHDMIPTAVAALKGTGIPVAAVSTGFPAGLSPFHLRVQEIRESVEAGAAEIDIVISRRHVLTGNWQALYDEMKEFREACGDAHVKAILATGELGTLRNVARASFVCMMAGADFIKTSTGKEGVNATLPVSLTMIRAIRAYHEGDRPPRRLQTRRRHLQGQGRAHLSRPYQGRTGRPLAPTRPVPLRSFLASERHRTATRTLHHRPLFGWLPAPDGLIRHARPET